MADQQPSESFLEVAQREMILFENKEREFRRRAKQEDAEERHLPIAMAELH